MILGQWMPVAYAENFHKKFKSFRSVAYGGYLHLVCAVCDVIIWRHIHVFKPTFSRSLLTQYTYSSSRILILCAIELSINYQRSI